VWLEHPGRIPLFTPWTSCSHLPPACSAPRTGLAPPRGGISDLTRHTPAGRLLIHPFNLRALEVVLLQLRLPPRTLEAYTDIAATAAAAAILLHFLLSLLCFFFRLSHPLSATCSNTPPAQSHLPNGTTEPSTVRQAKAVEAERRLLPPHTPEVYPATATTATAAAILLHFLFSLLCFLPSFPSARRHV